jgi:hypothetical protein
LLTGWPTGRTTQTGAGSLLGGLDETTLARLRAAGLADGVPLTNTTLGAFLERCFAALSVKP